MQYAKIRTALHNPRPVLGLDYGPHVPLQVLQRMERWGKMKGVPLHQLELLGQERESSEGFAEACEQGREEAFLLDEVDWEHLEGRLHARPPIFN